MASEQYEPNPKAERAYADYVALGENRSLRELARRYRTSTENPPTTWVDTLKRWSTKYGWQERLLQVQQEQSRRVERETQAYLEKARKKLRENGVELSTKLIEKARAMLEFPLAEVTVHEEDGKRVTIIQPAGWRMRDVARLLEVGYRVGSLATDQATDNVAVSGSIKFREVVAHIPASVRALVDSEREADDEVSGTEDAEDDGDDSGEQSDY